MVQICLQTGYHCILATVTVLLLLTAHPWDRLAQERVSYIRSVLPVIDKVNTEIQLATNRDLLFLLYSSLPLRLYKTSGMIIIVQS